MHTNDLIIDDRGTGQTIKRIAKLLPHFHGETPTTLVVKAVNTIDAGTFMISTKQKEIFGVFDFVSKQKAHHFERLFAAIHVVT
jgi:aminoglycoside phosphotransferase family enzyme